MVAVSAVDDVREWEARGRHVERRRALGVGARRARVRRPRARPAARAARLPVVLVRLAPRARRAARATGASSRVDFLGFGLSDKPDLRYSMRLQADVVEGVARQLGLHVGRAAHARHGRHRRRRAARAQPRGNVAVRGHAARPHQRQHLHRHGAPDAPASSCCSSLDDAPTDLVAGRRVQGRARGHVLAEERGRRRRARRAVAARRAQRRPPHAARARFATSRTAAPRNDASPARSRRTRRRSRSCGVPTTRSRSSR